MSVPKSQRRQSEVEYIVILQQLEQYFIECLKQDYKVPILSEKLVEKSIETYNFGTRYFELCNGKVQGTLAQKKKYCKETMWNLRELASQSNILVACRMKDNKSIKGLLENIQKMSDAFDLLQNQLRKLNQMQE